MKEDGPRAPWAPLTALEAGNLGEYRSGGGTSELIGGALAPTLRWSCLRDKA